MSRAPRQRPSAPDPADSPPPVEIPAELDASVDVHARTAALFHQLLDEAEHILRAGTTANKIALMKSVIPALMRELQSQNEAAAASDQKAALDKLFSDARSQISGS